MADLLNPAPLQFEPLRKNRWVLRFPSDLGISEFMLKSAARPSINIKDTEIQFLNTSTYVAGRYNWENISVSIRDLISPSSSQAIMEWIRLCAESTTGRMGYAAGYQRDLELDMLDPTGVTVQKWIIKNAFVTQANFGSLDYSDDDVADISLTLRPQYCVLAY